MEVLITLWMMTIADKAIDELYREPPPVKVEKLEVDPALYYPDLANLEQEMLDPDWINKK
jgi:hypothetical protein